MHTFTDPEMCYYVHHVHGWFEWNSERFVCNNDRFVRNGEQFTRNVLHNVNGLHKTVGVACTLYELSTQNVKYDLHSLIFEHYLVLLGVVKHKIISI